MPLHDALDLGKLVAWEDREAGRFSANRLVLGHRHRKPFCAVPVPALTCELDRFPLGLDVDEVRRDLGYAFVYLAKQRLVLGETFLSCPPRTIVCRVFLDGKVRCLRDGKDPPSSQVGGSPVRVEDVFRDANERVAAKAGELKFAYPIPFLCECRDPHCFAHISLTLGEYEQARSNPRR